MTGSAADWQLRRLPPLCLGLLGATGSASRRGAECLATSLPTPLPSHLHPPSRRPPALGLRLPSSARSPELRENEAVAAAASSGGCDSLTGAIDGRRRGFHGEIYLRRDRTAAIEEGSAPGGLKRGDSWHLPSGRRLGSTGPACRPLLSPLRLPTVTQPSGPTLAGLFREGVKAVGLSMETGTFFYPVEEEDLLFSKSE